MEALNSTELNVIQVGTPEELAVNALKMFVDSANNAIGAKGKFHVAISGGHTPAKFFELLGGTGETGVIQWDRVHLFWVDERCVRPDDEASNYRLAAESFLSKVAIPPGNVHRIHGECCDYAKAVREYEETIRRVFNLAPAQVPEFDLMVLGMGPDGHVGSLFPNSYARFDTEALVSAVYIADGDYSRITLTHPVLRAASKLVILVSGPEKADILRDVMQSELDEVRYPVHTLWPVLDKVTWLVDSEAGKYL
ncbi:MAG: 6-phosphogluconolactonase [Planctomycetota bacterium]|nr:MAG: 6-phosphogluconolactonase [Planctomycetota bacterium]